MSAPAKVIGGRRNRGGGEHQTRRGSKRIDAGNEVWGGHSLDASRGSAAGWGGGFGRGCPLRTAPRSVIGGGRVAVAAVLGAAVERTVKSQDALVRAPGEDS
eukprot:6194992-Pleurochrysis_carterae.AAC.1